MVPSPIAQPNKAYDSTQAPAGPKTSGCASSIVSMVEDMSLARGPKMKLSPKPEAIILAMEAALDLLIHAYR